LAVQYPQTAKPSTSATDSTAQRRSTTAQRGTSQSAIGRQAFHDRMRELWTDHVVYTRNFIVSATSALPDTAEVSQRLLRNQDEIGEAIKPYYGDAAGSQLASLLRSHVQLVAKAVTAAKGTTTAMNMPNQSSNQFSNNMRADTASRADTSQSRINSQYPSNPNAASRIDTTQARRGNVKNDTTQARINSQYPTAQGRRNQADTTKRNPNARVTGDTISQRLPSNQYGNVRTDTTQKNVEGQSQQTQQYGQSQQYGVNQQAGQVDSTALNQAIAQLKANGDSIAMFLSQANPRGFSRQVLSNGLQMHVTFLQKEITAQIKKDWSGSISAFDNSERQILQMADMLSDGIMKQFPSRFSNKATTVSSR
jgi:hypothetical protein